MKNDERNCAMIQPGMVLSEEEASDWEDGGQRKKHDLDHDLDREEWMDQDNGSFGSLTKRPRTRTPESEADALFGQWV